MLSCSLIQNSCQEFHVLVTLVTALPPFWHPVHSYLGIYSMLTLLDKSSCGRVRVACFSLLDLLETSVRMESWRRKLRDTAGWGSPGNDYCHPCCQLSPSTACSSLATPSSSPSPAPALPRAPQPHRPARLCRAPGHLLPLSRQNSAAQRSPHVRRVKTSQVQ